MNIKFQHIHIENFMSLGDVSIDLQDSGYVLVSGINNNPADLAKSNGSGKSSIFDAIMWCLTGNTVRGNKDVKNIHTSEGAVVELTFIVDDKTYTLTRSKNHSKLKTNLKIVVDNDNYSGKGIRDSEKILVELLPDLTASLIGSVIILGQGLPERFTNNSPSGRKAVLEKLCKTDFMIQELKDKISERKTALAEAIRTVEDSSLVLHTKLQVAQQQLEAAREREIQLKKDSDFDDKVQTLTATINYYKNLLEETDNNISVLTTTCEQLKQQYDTLIDTQTDEQSAIHDKWGKVLNDIEAQIATKLPHLYSMKQELAKLQAIVDICPTCGQHLSGVNKPDTTQLQAEISEAQKVYDALVAARDKAHIDFEKELNAVKDVHNDDERALSAELKLEQSYLQSAKENQSSILNTQHKVEQELFVVQLQKDNYLTDMEECSSAISKYAAEIADYEKQLDNNYREKDNLEVRLGIVNKFNSIVAREFRGYLLTSVIDFISSRAKLYCKDIFETDLITFSLDGNNIAIMYDNKEYESLSGGEKQKVDLIVQFAIRDMLCKYTGFSTNIIVLDEIFDNLDSVGCNRVINLLSSKLTDVSSIFIITHHGAELNIPYDQEIVVVKDVNGVSYLR